MAGRVDVMLCSGVSAGPLSGARRSVRLIASLSELLMHPAYAELEAYCLHADAADARHVEALAHEAAELLAVRAELARVAPGHRVEVVAAATTVDPELLVIHSLLVGRVPVIARTDPSGRRWWCNGALVDVEELADRVPAARRRGRHRLAGMLGASS